MREMKHIFGPVPSRRLGRSLGVSAIPKKTCNYSCVYCQLGRTDKMTNTPREFYPVNEILAEFKQCAKDEAKFDVVSLVGEGEPTLYAPLKELLLGIKSLTQKPIAVITNGSLLGQKSVREGLKHADIILPSFDAFNEAGWKQIDRPHGSLCYKDAYEGLISFSKEFKGLIFLEIMLLRGVNDDLKSLEGFKNAIAKVRYDKLYINTPVRPPAEKGVEASLPESIKTAANLLNGISIDALANGGFYSEIKDDYEAVLSIIKRHPMSQFEVQSFLESRNTQNCGALINRLNNDKSVNPINYKGYITYRLK